jgi:hypothetical protein
MELHYYRTATGNEIDLVRQLPSRRLWAIKIKLSSVLKVAKGFHLACADLKPSAMTAVSTATMVSSTAMIAASMVTTVVAPMVTAVIATIIAEAK